MSFTPDCQSDECILMGWGGSVDVQQSWLYLSEPFLPFLALFGLVLGRFFGAEAPAVSGSGCGGFSSGNSSSYDPSAASTISSKSDSFKSASSSSISNINSTISWLFPRDFVRMFFFDDAILEIKNSKGYIIKKLDLTTLSQAGNFWRDEIEPKLILEKETNVIEFIQILLSEA